MDYSKINFERLRKGGLKSILDSIEKVFREMDIDFYLIGAIARDVWTNHIEFQGKRTTRDIDFCLYVLGISQYEDVQKQLKEKEGFVRDDKEPYRMYSRDGHIIDLIPFGGIEQDNTVFLNNPPVALSVFATKEATDNAIPIDGIFKVITLPGLCILKLFAWNDKPDRRGKDLEDFYFLLKNYFEISGEQLYEPPFDDLLTENFRTELASARMLGRQMKVILDVNNVLKEKLIALLPKLFKGFTLIEVEELYKANQEDKQILCLKMIAEVINGLSEAPPYP